MVQTFFFGFHLGSWKEDAGTLVEQEGHAALYQWYWLSLLLL